MGNACLGQPRKNSSLMKRKELKVQRYVSSPNVKLDMNELSAVAGQSEGNKMKIKVNLITCGVCMQNYNITNRQPMLVCPNNHTYCKECASKSYNSNKKCPECRATMREPIRNRDIFQLVQDNQKIIQEHKLQPILQIEGEQIMLTVDEAGECYSSFWVKDNRVMKILNNMTWEGFISHETLPKDRQSYYTMKVVFSEFGNIKLGIVGKGYLCEKGVTCKEAVVYHLADGKILEGGKGVGSEWRGQGQAIALKSLVDSVITVYVNPMQGRVSWMMGDKKLGEGRFSNYLKENQFVAYILLCHKEDIVELNVQ